MTEENVLKHVFLSECPNLSGLAGFRNIGGVLGNSYNICMMVFGLATKNTLGNNEGTEYESGM